MEHEPKTKYPLRCFCSRKPLLAYYGVGKDNDLYVHVKVYKQSRMYGELLFSGGTVKIRCRECLRWHKIIFQKNAVSTEEVDEPWGG